MEGGLPAPTSETREMEMRQRLTSLEDETRLETASRCWSRGEWPCRKPRRPPPLSPPDLLFRILTISFLLCLFTVGIDHWSRSHQVTAAELLETPITNNKIFHHNRTTPAALAAAAKLKPPPPASKSKDAKGKRPKSDGGQRPSPPHHPPPPSNVNINNYLKTAMNILNLGLAAVATTTPKSIGWGQGGGLANQSPLISSTNPLTPFIPFKTTTTLDPLAVLQSQSNFSREAPPKGPPNNKGRSTFDFEPLFESESESNGTTTTTGGGNSGKNLRPGFFDNFEDHWDDPIAEESVPNSFNVVAPPPPFRPSVVRPPPSHWVQKHGYWNPSGSGSPHVTHKDVNYWPSKLNSYYGIRKPEVRRPPEPPEFPNRHTGYMKNPEGNHFAGTHNKHYEDDTYDMDEPEVGSLESESVHNVKKATVMDRVSVFYSEYKILAWAIVVVLAAVVALGALLGLYLNNPPTEVVSARQDLTRAMNDPQLLTFLDSLSSSSSSRLPSEKGANGSRQKGQT